MNKISKYNLKFSRIVISKPKKKATNKTVAKKKVAKPKKCLIKFVEKKEEENLWDKMTDKQKIEHIKKLMNNGSGKKNPLTGNKLFNDAEEIGDIGDRFMKVVNRLENHWYNDDCGPSAAFDDFIISYQDDIMKDILNGSKINEMVKEYKECM